MAAAPVIGLGLSAVSTINTLNQQKRQARLQREALDQQALDAQTRLALAREQRDYTVKAAQQVKDKELALNQAQRTQAMAQLQGQALQQQLSSIQSRVAADETKATAEQTANKMLGDAAGNIAQGNLQNANESEQLNAASINAESQTAGQSVAKQQQSVLGTQELADRNTQNAQVRSGLLSDQEAIIQQYTQSLQQIANAQSGYISSTDAIQQDMTRAGLGSQRRQINLQTRRNALGINAANYSRQANGTLQYLSQSIDTQGQLAQIGAQRANIQSPGFLSYLGAGASLGMQAYQSGLLSGVFNRGGSSTPTVRGPSGLQGVNALSSTINQYPPGMNAPVYINNYPPIRATVADNA